MTLLTLLVVARTRAAAPRLPVFSGGVGLSHVGRSGVGRGAMVDASEGDWLLESDRVRLVVGADVPSAQRQVRFGAVIDATAKTFTDDALTDLRPRVEVGGVELPLRTEAVQPYLLGERPQLRIIQSSRDARLAVTTDIGLRPGQPIVELATTIRNVTDRAIAAVSLGDRSRWLGAPTFAPLLGYVKYAARERPPWIGRDGARVSYALSFLDQLIETTFRFDRVGPIGQVSMTSAAELGPGAERMYRRLFIVQAGGLHAAAAEAWRTLGKKVGLIRGTLDPAPAWATVDALDLKGKPLLSVSVRAPSGAARKGSYELAVPAGTYRLVLRSPGGERAQAVDVVAGEVLQVALQPPRPARLVLQAADRALSPLVTRWVVRGLAPTKDPEFGPVERAQGARNIVYARDGRIEVDVPAGRYHLLATHGPEYSIYSEELTASAGERVTVPAQLVRMVETPGHVACDFHLHAMPSHDSTVSLEDRVLSLAAEGIEFAVASDHNHITDYAPAIEDQKLGDQLSATPGVELTTKTWGHFNVFPMNKGAALPTVEGSAPADVFATIRRTAPGSVIQVNHPRMKGVGYFNRMDSEGEGTVAEGFSFDFDTLEVLNGFELGSPSTIDANIREWFALLNAGRRYTAVGNSDSHRLVYQWAGYPRTYVRVPNDEPGKVRVADIVDALRHGRATVSSGPFLSVRMNGTAEPGDAVVPTAKRVTLTISAFAPDWVDLKRADVFVNGVRVATLPAAPHTGGPRRIEAEVALRAAEDSWVVVIVRGEKLLDSVLPGTRAAPLAFNNPIYIDANDDGRLELTSAQRPIREPSRAGAGAALPNHP